MLLPSPIHLLICRLLLYDAAVTMTCKMNMIFTAEPCFHSHLFDSSARAGAQHCPWRAGTPCTSPNLSLLL